MARPINKGLSYYPIDCNHFDDRKIKRLIRSHSGNGYMVYQYLLSLIYSNGYFLYYDEELNFDVSDTLRIDENDVKSIIKKCFELGLFNAELFEKYQIFTSEGIQKRWLKIIKDAKRKDKIEKNYSINSEETLVSSEVTPVNSEETLVSSEVTPVNSVLMQQRKEKKRKEKERKEKKSSQEDSCLTGTFFNFSCKDKNQIVDNAEVQSLIQKYPNVDVLAYLNAYEKYCANGGEKIPIASNLMKVIENSLTKKSDENIDYSARKIPYQKVF